MSSTDSDEDVSITTTKEEDMHAIHRKKKRIGCTIEPISVQFSMDDEDEVFAWALDIDMISTPKFQEKEDVKMGIWSEYFGTYGVMMEPIITQRFGDILLDDGVPRM